MQRADGIRDGYDAKTSLIALNHEKGQLFGVNKIAISRVSINRNHFEVNT
jgi:hypothetical protein